MAGDTMEIMPMSPRQSPAELGSALLAWTKSRRGRTLGIFAVSVLVLLGIMGAKHSEVSSHSFRRKDIVRFGEGCLRLKRGIK